MAIPFVVGDVVRILLKGRLPNGDDMLNVFHYEVMTASTTDTDSMTLENLAFGFWENLKAPLRNMVSSAFNFDQVDCLSLTPDFAQINGETFVIPVGERPGLQPGDYQTAFTTYTFKYVRPSLAFRHGWKRFAGVAEAVSGNGTVQGVGVTGATALATALANDIAALYPDATPIVDPADARPIIYRATFNGDPVSPVQYAAPASIVFNGIGSQNTRK